MEEIWKPVKGYEGRYEVSNFGVVKSLNYNKTGVEKELSQSTDKDGYKRVGLFDGKRQKQFFVHRIVAEAFLDNPYNLPQINHKDENPANNHVENIEYCSSKYNINYGTRTSRASSKQLNRHGAKSVSQYDSNGNLIKTYPSTKEAMRQTGIRNGNICTSCKNGCKAGGFIWRYVP